MNDSLAAEAGKEAVKQDNDNEEDKIETDAKDRIKASSPKPSILSTSKEIQITEAIIDTSKWSTVTITEEEIVLESNTLADMEETHLSCKSSDDNEEKKAERDVRKEQCNFFAGQYGVLFWSSCW